LPAYNCFAKQLFYQTKGSLSRHENTNDSTARSDHQRSDSAHSSTLGSKQTMNCQRCSLNLMPGCLMAENYHRLLAVILNPHEGAVVH
ncbi:hypothetical protein T4A_11106, partial [Trichinella pseudospiralis]